MVVPDEEAIPALRAFLCRSASERKGMVSPVYCCSLADKLPSPPFRLKGGGGNAGFAEESALDSLPRSLVVPPQINSL